MDNCDLCQSAQHSAKVTNTMTVDIENAHAVGGHLENDIVHSLSWSDIGVVVKDRQSKKSISILSSAYGHVEAGQVVALMGPSGSGKTTLLNVLAHRVAAASAQVSGEVLINRTTITRDKLRQISSYVEQEDALIGSLTVRETVDFAARLSLPSSVRRQDRRLRVDDLIESFGLQAQAHTIVGTAIRKGISGGQKRRVSVASQLVTSPKILFLDEPTSGLDSAASYEVMRYIKNIARKHHLIVIASIHQPSTTTFELFDRLLLLSQGKTCYFGSTAAAPAYFGNISHHIPVHTNPAEFLLDLVNVDFTREEDKETSRSRLGAVHEAWERSPELSSIKAVSQRHPEAEKQALTSTSHDLSTKLMQPMILLHRNFIKSYRDVIAYGIRVFMYTGLAIMVGTVWLRLDHHQSSIQPYINAIFFGSAFMSFMAVAYVPAIIEDLHTFKKERANGLYGPLPFIIANFLIGLPYLFLISVIFSVIAYWLSNFQPTAKAFFTWVMWLFLDLLAAEGLVVLVTSIAPIFVVSLAVTAFVNGLWMSVGGFLVPLGTLNVFWKYVFHYWDYQAYVFQGMMVNQFQDTVYDCQLLGGSGADAHQYSCMYPSDLASQGQISGTAVLEAYHYGTDHVGEWVGIMIAIIFGYRIAGYLALWLKKN